MDVPQIDADGLAAEVASGGFVLDVRQPDEYEEGHIRGAALMPLGQVVARLGEVPTDRTVYVMCRTGSRSQRVAEFLVAQGVDAVNLAGGIVAWAEGEHPVATGPEPG